MNRIFFEEIQQNKKEGEFMDVKSRSSYLFCLKSFKYIKKSSFQQCLNYYRRLPNKKLY
jgi:hypothetical protein